MRWMRWVCGSHGICGWDECCRFTAGSGFLDRGKWIRWSGGHFGVERVVWGVWEVGGDVCVVSGEF